MHTASRAGSLSRRRGRSGRRRRDIGWPLRVHAGKIDERQIDVQSDAATVRARILQPFGARGLVPVVLYVRDRTRGGAEERLIREFAVGAGTAVMILEHRSRPARSRPSEAQVYAVVRWLTEHGVTHGLDASRIAIADDSPGPTGSSGQVGGTQFADGPHLSGRAMAWFWAHYRPQIPSTAFAIRK